MASDAAAAVADVLAGGICCDAVAEGICTGMAIDRLMPWTVGPGACARSVSFDTSRLDERALVLGQEACVCVCVCKCVCFCVCVCECVCGCV